MTLNIFLSQHESEQKHRECFQLVLSSERLKCWQQAKEAETGGMCTPLPVRRLNCCVPTGTAAHPGGWAPPIPPFSLFFFNLLSLSQCPQTFPLLLHCWMWVISTLSGHEKVGLLSIKKDQGRDKTADRYKTNTCGPTGWIYSRAPTAYQTSRLPESGSMVGGVPGPGVVPHAQTLRQVVFKDGSGIWHARGNSVRLSLWSPCRQCTVFIFALKRAHVNSVWGAICTCF